MVLTRLQKENLKVKLSKRCFFQQQVKYLGHVVSTDGVATDPDKIAAVAKYTRTTFGSRNHSWVLTVIVDVLFLGSHKLPHP